MRATSDQPPATRQRPVGPTWERATLIAVLFAWHGAFVAGHGTAEAAVSESDGEVLQAGGFSEAGPGASSSKYRQQLSVGDVSAGASMMSSRYKIVPGILGSALTGVKARPVEALELSVLRAKTEPLGAEIAQGTWQTDRDPIFIWEPPAMGVVLGGYSYAFDEEPDEIVETTGTSYDMAAEAAERLSDGVHTFYVRAVNSAGNPGPPLGFEIWVDGSPPEISSYAPAPGTLLNTTRPTITAVLAEAHSGLDASTTSLLVNSRPVQSAFDAGTHTLTSDGGGALTEGTNHLELHVRDLVGNAQAPLVWSVTVDTIPPEGELIINGGAAMTTSPYVTLAVNASDATSQVVAMRISNDAMTGFVEEPFAAVRELWRLPGVRGVQTVYAVFRDAAGNESSLVLDEIELILLSPETVITSGPAGFTQNLSAEFTYACPDGDCVFSSAVDHASWSDWSTEAHVSFSQLGFGNHYFRVKAAREANGLDGIQPDEEDPSPAERTWIVGVEPAIFTGPKGPPVKLWRLE